MKRRINLILPTGIVILVAVTFSHIWSSSWTSTTPTPQEIQTQTGLLKDIAAPCLTIDVGIFGTLAYIGYVRQKRGWTPKQLERLRHLYSKILILLAASSVFGIPLLINLVSKPSLMGRLPLAIWSIRTGLFLQLSLLGTGFFHAILLVIKREK